MKGASDDAFAISAHVFIEIIEISANNINGTV